MAYTFKKLSEVGQLNKPTEQTHVLVEDNSEIKKILVDNLGSGTVKSVNKLAPDENGDINIEFPSYTVNGAAADENGNFEIEIPECTVKSVNGVEPDENGNIEIEVSGGGGASSWEDLTDKPFDILTEGFIINSENGFENSEIVIDIGDGAKLYHVSDRFITLEEMKRGSTKVNQLYNEEQYFYEESFEECFGDNSYTIGELNMAMVLSVDHDNAEIAGIVLPKAGTYFSHSEMTPGDETIICDIEYLNITPKIKKLDVKFLPNGIGYDIEVPAQSIPEQTIEVSGYGSPAIIQGNLTIVKDTMYEVTFDGEQYDCRGKYSNAKGICFIGNGEIAGLDYMWSNEPFVIASSPENKMIVAFAKTSGTHTFSINSQSTVDYVIIDPKYLPEPVGRIDFGGGEVFNDANGAKGLNSHAEGFGTFTFGETAHAEGYFTIASGEGSHSEGKGSLNYKTFRVTPTEVQSSYDSITDSELAGAVNENDILYVKDTFITVWKKSGDTVYFSPSIQNEYLNDTLYIDFPGGLAYGNYSHSEGEDTRAYGDNSHSEGQETVAYSHCSHTEGQGTKATGDFSHVQGRYNIEDTDGQYAHIVGNGESDENRSNAHTLDWYGNAWYANSVAAKYFVLESPDGSLFKITVDNSGTLSAEAMPE